MGASGMVNANEHQGRVERDRRERIRGHAMDFALEVERDDGDSSGEATHRLAEFGRIQSHHHKRNAAAEATAYITMP